MVGNSLTEDAGVFGNSGGQQAIVYDTGVSVVLGWHILHQESLTDIVASPGTFSEVMPAQWNVALPAASRQLLTFEPYPTNATLASEATAFETLAASAAGNAKRYFLYETWPPTTLYSPTYAGYWTAAVVDGDGTPFTQQMAAYTAVYTRLQAALGASNVWVIPAGDVFAQIDVLARAGQIPGIATVADLYRDTEHMGDVGKFVAADTVVATQQRQKTNSAGNAKTLAYFQFGQGPTLTPSLAAQMETIVWSVVSTDQRAMH